MEEEQWDDIFFAKEGYYMEEEIVEFCPDVNEGDNLEVREKECQEVDESLQENKEGDNMEKGNVELPHDANGGDVDESLEENEEDEPIDGVDYMDLCIFHFHQNKVNELLQDDKYLLHESMKPSILHTRKRHHLWLKR